MGIARSLESDYIAEGPVVRREPHERDVRELAVKLEQQHLLHILSVSYSTVYGF
jgi:hypothetical protein